MSERTYLVRAYCFGCGDGRELEFTGPRPEHTAWMPRDFRNWAVRCLHCGWHEVEHAFVDWVEDAADSRAEVAA